MKKFKIRVPATSANLGPGFDIIGISLSLYNYIELELDSEFSIIYNKGNLPLDKNNLVYYSFSEAFKSLELEVPNNIKIKVEVNIPICRGLGSSSSAILGGIYLANLYLKNKLDNNFIIKLATKIEGHPDNVVPCLNGGLNISMIENEKIFTKKINIKKDYKFVLSIPEFEISTKDARKVLPKYIDFNSAVFNMSRSLFLIKAFEEGDDEILKICLNDKIHQPYRKNLIPFFDDIYKISIDNNSLGCVISGSGPTILNITDNGNYKNIANLIQNYWETKGINSYFEILSIDNEGIKQIY
jgi:homoserine kinase